MSGRTNNKVLSIKEGTSFGLWKTVKPSRKWDYILCTCKCGKQKDVNVYSLTSGKSKSCGCDSVNIRQRTKQEWNNG